MSSWEKFGSRITIVGTILTIIGTAINVILALDQGRFAYEHYQESLNSWLITHHQDIATISPSQPSVHLQQGEVFLPPFAVGPMNLHSNSNMVLSFDSSKPNFSLEVLKDFILAHYGEYMVKLSPLHHSINVNGVTPIMLQAQYISGRRMMTDYTIYNVSWTLLSDKSLHTMNLQISSVIEDR